MSDIKKSVGKSGLDGLINIDKPKPKPKTSTRGSYWDDTDFSTGGYWGRSSKATQRSTPAAGALKAELVDGVAYVSLKEIERVTEHVIKQLHSNLYLKDVIIQHDMSVQFDDELFGIISGYLMKGVYRDRDRGDTYDIELDDY